MKLEIYLFFESVAMILLILSIIVNLRGKDVNEKGEGIQQHTIPWIVPLLATVLFGALMFAPINNVGTVEIVNVYNESDSMKYDYDVTVSGTYMDTLVINFMFFLISAIITVYSMMMSAGADIYRGMKEIVRG